MLNLQKNKKIDMLKVICRNIIKENNLNVAQSYKTESAHLHNAKAVASMNRWQDFKDRRQSIVYAYLKALNKNQLKNKVIIMIKIV